MKLTKTETINLRILVPTGLTAAAMVGATTGYLVASRILKKKYQAIADAEIQEAKVFYQELYSRVPMKAEKAKKPEEDELRPGLTPGVVEEVELIQEAVEALDGYQPTHEESTAPTVVVQNIFANHTPPGEEVLAALMADRDPSGPYIITKDEYFTNEPDHEQKTFTFFEGDSVLAPDESEYDWVEDTEKVVGEDNLLRFGYGSADEHVLYIRNETLDPPLDLCITRSSGKYADEVVGMNEENEPYLEHEQRRFRTSDE